MKERERLIDNCFEVLLLFSPLVTVAWFRNKQTNEKCVQELKLFSYFVYKVFTIINYAKTIVTLKKRKE